MVKETTIYPLGSLFDNRGHIATTVEKIHKRGSILYPLTWTESLRGATNNLDAFRLMLDNYIWCKENSFEFSIPEFDNISPLKKSTFYQWVLETYCLGKSKKEDDVVKHIISLHKKIVDGNNVSEEEWKNAEALAYKSRCWAAMFTCYTYAVYTFGTRILRYFSAGFVAVSAAANTEVNTLSVKSLKKKTEIERWEDITEKLYLMLNS